MIAGPRVCFGLLLFLGPALCAAQSRSPILVELFTSEGCSSCPPADLLLQKLDPQVIVLSEHVDYWNQLGWKDPFSSAEFTARQRGYVRMLNLEDVYTPQMIVDGEAGFVGNDGRRALDAIASAGRHKKADLHISRTDAGLSIDVPNVSGSPDIFLALADDSDVSQVAAGENHGRRLTHVAVLRSLQKLGKVKHGQEFHRTVELPKTAGAHRVIVFLQESGFGRIAGVAMLPPSTTTR